MNIYRIIFESRNFPPPLMQQRCLCGCVFSGGRGIWHSWFIFRKYRRMEKNEFTESCRTFFVFSGVERTLDKILIKLCRRKSFGIRDTTSQNMVQLFSFSLIFSQFWGNNAKVRIEGICHLLMKEISFFSPVFLPSHFPPVKQPHCVVA